jgi:GTPase SAR1 family protein
LSFVTHVIARVIGATGTGKTSFINKLTGSTFAEGHGLESCTEDLQIAVRSSIFSERRTMHMKTNGHIYRDDEVVGKIAAWIDGE